MEIQQTELLRYLGWHGQEIDDSLQDKLDGAAKRCLELATPRSLVRKFALNKDMTLSGTDFLLEGEDIRAHLGGCKEIYLLAATVGLETERETAKLFAEGKATDALLMDTAASCAVEAYADDICADLEKSGQRALTERFSCGYGDFPLSAQPKILRLLSADTRLGLYTDESFLLSPRKSITAVIGITDAPAPTRRHSCANKCAHCKNACCAYRKDK